MTTVPMPEAFSIGRVISRLFGVLQRNLVTFLLLSLLLVGLPSAIVAFLQISAASPVTLGGSTGDAFSNAFTPLRVSLGIVAFVVGVVGNAVLQAGVIHASVSDLSGGRASFGECLSTGARYFLPLLCIGLIVGICCTLGLLFFVVPGIMLGLAWFVAAPIEVVERKGIAGSLARSLELTRNHRWAILGLCVLYSIATWIVQATLSGGVIAATAGAASQGATAAQSLGVARAVVGLLTGTLFASISSAGIASVYFELRQTKEGVGVDQLAALFD